MKYFDFYTAETARRQKKQIRTAVLLTVLFALAAVGICLWLLITAGTLSARKHEMLTFIVNGAFGAAVIFTWLNVITPRRRTLSHLETVLSGEQETVEYSCGLTLAEAPERVPGSVSVRRVTVNGGPRPQRLLVLERCAPLLKEAGECGTLTAVNGYICGLAPETGGADG